MKPILGRYVDVVYTLLRVIAGLMFSCHGMQKLFGAFGGMPPGIPAFVQYVGGTIEFAGGLLVAIGLFTSTAAFVASGMMAVAYFMVHQPQGALPIMNHGEPAVVYCWLFLYIAARGTGPYGVQPD
jgi:putative oxidoreductase